MENQLNPFSSYSWSRLGWWEYFDFWFLHWSMLIGLKGGVAWNIAEWRIYWIITREGLISTLSMLIGQERWIPLSSLEGRINDKSTDTISQTFRWTMTITWWAWLHKAFWWLEKPQSPRQLLKTSSTGCSHCSERAVGLLLSTMRWCRQWVDGWNCTESEQCTAV